MHNKILRKRYLDEISQTTHISTSRGRNNYNIKSSVKSRGLHTLCGITYFDVVQIVVFVTIINSKWKLSMSYLDV